MAGRDLEAKGEEVKAQELFDQVTASPDAGGKAIAEGRTNFRKAIKDYVNCELGLGDIGGE